MEVDFSLLKLRNNLPDNTGGQPVLKFKAILLITLEPSGPQVRACSRVHQLDVDPDAFSVFAQSAFQRITHVQFSCNLRDVGGSSFVGHTETARHNDQLTKLGQCSRNVIDESVDKIILVGFPRKICEGQDNNR